MPLQSATLIKPTIVSGAWTPASLPSVRSWWDASDTASITSSSGAVSQINDKTGNGFHLTQTTAAAKPTTGSRTVNSLNVLDFDGGDFMTNATLTATQPNTIWLAFLVDVDDNHTVFDGINTRQVIFQDGVWIWFAGSSQFTTTNTDLTAAHLGVAIFDNAADHLYIDNNAITVGNPGTNNLDGVTLFANFAENGKTNGAFLEGGVTDVDMASGDRDTLHTYISTKWGTA